MTMRREASRRSCACQVARPRRAVERPLPSLRPTLQTGGAIVSTSSELPPLSSLTIHAAINSAELRAAAYLRAASFFTYPPDRSKFSARSHQRMKADSEWDELERKLKGTALGYEQVAVCCLIATLADDVQEPVSQQAAAEVDLSAKLPADEGSLPRVVVGTLDVNYGVTLPAEELVGALPLANARQQRAYLSNVCVSRAARRRGIAQSLIRAAEGTARQQGVLHLYVHVVYDNAPALKLYHALGFIMESQESDALAHGLNRPRRLLLGKPI